MEYLRSFNRESFINYCIWVARHNYVSNVSNFYSSSGNEREQKIILVEKVDTKTVIWQNGLSENLPN